MTKPTDPHCSCYRVTIHALKWCVETRYGGAWRIMAFADSRADAMRIRRNAIRTDRSQAC